MENVPEGLEGTREVSAKKKEGGNKREQTGYRRKINVK